MSKKFIWIIAVILVIIVGGVFYFLYQQQNKNKIEIPIIEQQTGKTNNFENSQLVEIAKQYVLKKPQLYWNREKFVNWDNYNELGTDFAKASPEWIISQKSTIKYVEPNTYKSPYDDYNDKYIVNWFFIPGCEENPNSTERPNWFNKAGFHCLGGYGLGVIINPDGTVNHAELNAYD